MLVTGLALALLAALGVIGFQLLSGDNGSNPSAGPSSSNTSSTGGTGSSGTTPQSSGGTLPTTVRASDLPLVMPKTLLARCTDSPSSGAALATLDCSAPSRGVAYSVALYPDTAALQAAFKGVIAAQGIQEGSGGCTKSSWRGERPWQHPTGSLGGHVACYLDPSGDSVLVWSHMSKNQKGVAPQDDHRDVLGIARKHSQLPGDVLQFWSFWSGATGTSTIIGKVPS
jgi:hypothetical protein